MSDTLSDTTYVEVGLGLVDPQLEPMCRSFFNEPAKDNV